MKQSVIYFPEKEKAVFETAEAEANLSPTQVLSHG